MRYRNAIFDMDGVLIDNSEGIMYCARYAISRLGLDVPGDDVLRKFIGPALIYSLKTYAGAADEQAERGLYLYREKYLTEGIKMYRLYDGIREAAERLHDSGVRLSVSSGKPQECVDEILRTSGMTELFELTAGTVFPARVSSKDEQMKRAVLERPAVMIGDRVFDLECAENARVDCIFAKYGFGDESDLRGHTPVFIAEKPADIADFILSDK